MQIKKMDKSIIKIINLNLENLRLEEEKEISRVWPIHNNQYNNNNNMFLHFHNNRI